MSRKLLWWRRDDTHRTNGVADKDHDAAKANAWYLRRRRSGATWLWILHCLTSSHLEDILNRIRGHFLTRKPLYRTDNCHLHHIVPETLTSALSWRGTGPSLISGSSGYLRNGDHLRHSLRPLITGTGTLATTSASSRGPNATRSVWWKLRDLALSKVATNLTRTERAKCQCSYIRTFF